MTDKTPGVKVSGNTDTLNSKPALAVTPVGLLYDVDETKGFVLLKSKKY